MRFVRTAVATAISLVLATILLRWVFAELLARYEMWSTGALSRAELSEDYGMGMMGLLVVEPAAIAGGLAVAAITWFLLSRHNPPLHATRGKNARA